MDLAKLRTAYENAGYTRFLASARVCQDVILSKIANAGFGDHVTIKGGVLICAVSGNKRRATRDIDLDFIRYPLTDEGIERFVGRLAMVDDGVDLRITRKERLRQQDYHGVRVFLDVFDAKLLMQAKMDIGVHAAADIEQSAVVFDLFNNAESVSLLANTLEQSFAEKAGSPVKHGIRWTRYKDVFDMYYLGHRDDFDVSALRRCLTALVADNSAVPANTLEEIAELIAATLSSQTMRERIVGSKQAWVDVSTDDACDWLCEYLVL